MGIFFFCNPLTWEIFFNDSINNDPFFTEPTNRYKGVSLYNNSKVTYGFIINVLHNWESLHLRGLIKPNVRVRLGENSRLVYAIIMNT